MVDELVVYDDGSTDGSYEYMLNTTSHVIRGVKNKFANEIYHKQILLNEALKLSPDFILWLDADEVLSANAVIWLQDLCEYCTQTACDGVALQEVNIWRSHTWQRLDSLYDTGWFVRLWRVMPGISFAELKPGLHQQQYPQTLQKIVRVADFKVLHYGFSSMKNLAYKYLIYKNHGQRGYDMLDRLISEENLILQQISPDLVPNGLWDDDIQPKPMSFLESLTQVEKYRKVVFRPKFSIICLIYKDVKWLKFIYEQVLRYTDLRDKEFFFVANDANEDVVNYLRNNYIPHFIFNNTFKQREEWYINNVYRAYNFGAAKAQGDFLIFINSDMAFTPDWFDNLWKAYDGSNCITSRLVESGKLNSGLYGIEKNFGYDYDSYCEKEFQIYANKIVENKIADSGLYMPLFIRRQHFEIVGGYPEGNIIPDSDIFQPKIASKGQANISGDKVLMKKLFMRNIKHQTAFNSIVYHFQCGELHSKLFSGQESNQVKIAVCNDLVTGTMGERVLWDFILENCPATVGIDSRLVGLENYCIEAKNYINANYLNIEIIIQNASFIDYIDENKYTIAFLQDNLRGMGRKSLQQEKNLRMAQKLVTNSIQTALSYPEYDFEIIPVGVDEILFQPANKIEMRKKKNFDEKQRIGIFVGSLSDTKGWPKVRECIDYYQDIMWIVISKYNEFYSAPNVQFYSRISQVELVKLLNCADFFILGSPLETQCLAAIEACLCNIPVIMHNVGIFKDFTELERNTVGIFDDDFISSIKKINQKKFTPRNTILQKKLTVKDSMVKWNELLEKVFLEISRKKNIAINPIVSVIMPTFNQERFIAKAIDSVIEQTFTKWELIIVNDGSTDGTLNIIKRYFEQYPAQIKIINKVQNEGIARGLNDGLREASGQYICWLSSDDLFTKNKLERQVSFLKQNPQYGMVFSGYDWIDENGSLLNTIIMPNLEGMVLYRTLLKGDCIHGCSIMLNKEGIKQIGLFNPAFKYAQDYDMWLRIAAKLDIAYIPETMVKGRIHSQAGTQAGKNEVDAIGVICDFMFCNVAASELFKKAEFDNIYIALSWTLEMWYIQFWNKSQELLALKQKIDWMFTNGKVPHDSLNYIKLLHKKMEIILSNSVRLNQNISNKESLMEWLAKSFGFDVVCLDNDTIKFPFKETEIISTLFSKINTNNYFIIIKAGKVVVNSLISHKFIIKESLQVKDEYIIAIDSYLLRNSPIMDVIGDCRLISAGKPIWDYIFEDLILSGNLKSL